MLPCLMLLLLACTPTTPGVAPIGTPDPHVLVLVLDGVRTDELSTTTVSDLTGRTGEDFASNTWDALSSQAMIVRGAYNTGLTSTAPGHSMLVTGHHEPVFTVPMNLEDVGVYRPLVPTIFEEARGQKGWGEEEALLLANSIVMPQATHSIMPEAGAGARWEMVTSKQDPESPEDKDENVIKRLKEIINDGPPHVIVVNLHAADRTGHTGVMRDYLDRIQRQADMVPALWKWIQDNHPDYAWQLQMVVTADHGRHRIDTIENSWSTHGDSCSGCREVPWFVLGGDVKAGVVEGSYSLLDIAPTLASHLGIELPWAQGLAFGPEAMSARQGKVDIYQAGEHIAFSEYLDDLEHRSRLVVDGEVLSSPDAWAAEAPTLLESEDKTKLWACFRELRLDPEEDYMPWEPRCLEKRDGAWFDLGFAKAHAGPFFRASLVEKDGKLWAGWLYTPLTRIEDVDVDAVQLSNWDGSSWSPPLTRTIEFSTTDISIAATNAGIVLTAATNDAEPNQAYSRHIESFTWEINAVVAQEEFRIDPQLSGDGRVELPALRSRGDHLWLAMAELDENHRGLGWVESSDGGHQWGQTAFLPADGLFLNLPLQWDGSWLVFAQLVEGEAQLCRLENPVDTPDCLGLGSPRIDSFAVQNGQATAVVDEGAGDWATLTVVW